MQLSRKRRRELKKLRNQAEVLLDHQREVLGHAGHVLGEASRQAKELGNEHVMPRVESAVDQARPFVQKNVACARRAADRVRIAAAPVVAAALAGTVRSLERMEQTEASRQLRDFGEQRGLIEPVKKKRKGGLIALGVGIAAASAVGYALWQAFREDDDMWVSADDF